MCDLNNQECKPKEPFEKNQTSHVRGVHLVSIYTLRLICCILLICLAELCLTHYIYRLIKSEIQENYVNKNEVDILFLKASRDQVYRDELENIVTKLLHNIETKSRTKRSSNNLEDHPQDVVDFFHPNMKTELQEKDEIQRQKTGKGTAPGGDNWVWLTSYCRVTLASIQGYCTAASKYCPPSTPGPKGSIGSKGDRGETGFPGIPGPMGPRGYPGHPGDKGTQGRPGLDGRDGLPGEPGFDGMPGRNGQDGIPGKDGNAGLPGRDGRNGTDGRSGLTGPQGPPGPQGPKGLTGPRGRSGKPGNHGTPGIPGISAWKTKVNGSAELLIPPSIAAQQIGQPIGPAIITEGDNVTLHCAATGIPKPQVEWIRTDGQPITIGPWQAVTVAGYTLNITLISRSHMATYQCIADNGVPPQVNQTFIIEVHFTPLIRIRRDMIGAANGTRATMECEIEAFPEAIRYWEKADGRLLENSSKYEIINSIGRSTYIVKTQLTVNRISSNDFTRYYCVAKNEKGTTRASFTIYEVDPRLATPPPVYDTRVIEIGQKAPKRISQENICPPVTQCTECLDPKEFKCRESGISLFDLIGKWEIRQLGNSTYPGFANRTTDCVIYAVGKPVFLRYTNQTNGCWMRDPLEKDSEKFYTTDEDNAYRLFEYNNKSLFRDHTPSRTYKLTYPVKGNLHVVYNGSFYYNERDKPKIIKLNLSSESTLNVDVPWVVTNGSNYLYTTGNSYMDFSVDDNGLWVIYGISDTNNTAVMKLDPNSLQIQYIWNVSLNHHKVGEMFLVCGVLYAVDSVTDRESRIRFALDLYRNQLLDVNLPFSNPFRNTTMVGYNHKNRELYTWDRGNQLTYPIRYHEIGYKQKDEHEFLEAVETARHTGLEVYHNDD